MRGFFINPEHREYVRRRRAWEESLTQDTYTLEKAREIMGIGKNTMNELIKEGRLYPASPGARHRTVPKQAIVNYMVPERSFQSFLT